MGAGIDPAQPGVTLISVASGGGGTLQWEEVGLGDCEAVGLGVMESRSDLESRSRRFRGDTSGLCL